MSTDRKQLVRFCVTGSIVAAVDFALIWLFAHFMPRLAAVAVAYPLAVTLHFCLSRWWVFAAANESARVQIPRFVVVVLLCWLCTVGVTALAHVTVASNIFIAKAIALPCATVLSFFLMRHRVFQRNNASAGASGRCTGSD